MPMLDVSFVTRDPMLADCFAVTRRTDVIGANGRTTPTASETFEGLVGVVTQQDPAELMRREEGQTVPRRIFVASMFAFRGASKSADGATMYQPDVIRWNGTDYTVVQVFPYSRYGQGVYECVAASTVAIDVAQ